MSEVIDEHPDGRHPKSDAELTLKYEHLWTKLINYAIV
jgi:hypothetical protein